MTAINEPLADPRDMFAAHTMFRREFALIPALVRDPTVGDRPHTTLVAVPLIEKYITAAAEYAFLSRRRVQRHG
jgi:hypothetical protein